MASSSKATKFTTNIPPTEEDKEKAVAAATKKFTQQRQQQTHTACPPFLSVIISPENKQASSDNFGFTTPGTGVPRVPPGGDGGGNFREEMTNLFDIEDARRENEKKQLTAVVNNCDDKIEKLNEVNVAKNKEIERKEQQIIQDRAQYEETLKGREEECRDLERQLTAAKIETQKNIDDLKGAENNYIQFEEETQRYKETTTAQLTTMQDDTEKLEGTIAVLEQESVMKETAYEGLMVRYEEREREIVEEKNVSNGKYTKLVQEAAECLNTLKFAKEDLSVKETANQNLRTENGNLQGQISGVQSTVVTLEHEIVTLSDINTNVCAEKEKLTSEYAQLQFEHKSKQESHNTALTLHKKELASKDKTIKNVCAEKEELTSEKEQLQDKLKAKEESHNRALASKDENLASKEVELTTKDQELAQLHAEVEQLELEKEELKEVKEEQIEQMYDHWNDRERDENQGALELLKENRVRQQEGLARTEEEIARREKTPTPPILLDGRTLPVVTVIMDPTIALPEKCTKRGCLNRKRCRSAGAECNTVELKYQCPAGCGSGLLGTEKIWRTHAMGNKHTNGCVAYARKYPAYIKAYKQVYHAERGIYRPTFVLDARKGKDPVSQDEHETSAKGLEEKFKNHGY